MRQPATKKARVVQLTFVPDRAMTAHEFAVRAWMQYYGIGAPEAERLVSEAEARGGAGTGPHYENGVRADEVGKPIKVGFEVSQKTGGEAADEQARAEQLKGLPQPERSAVDVEADRRFWARTGMDTGKKLTTGAADASNRALWMQTRDEVMRDRNKLDALPKRTRDFLLPSGRQVTPQEYAAVLRIADKIKELSDDEWALYQRRINTSTDDYAKLEQSIDRFKAQQAAERKTAGRVAGTEPLWKLSKEWKKLHKSYTSIGVGGGATPRQSPQFVKQYEDATKALDQALKAANFKDLAEYDAACAEYLLLFKKRAVELTMLALNASERVVRSELARYRDPAGMQAVFDQLAGLRTIWGQVLDAGSRSQPKYHMGVGGGVGWYDKRTPAQEAAHEEWKEHVKRLEAERKAQSEKAPILKDPELLTGVLATKTSAGSLGKLLREDAEDRLAAVIKTRRRVTEDAEAVLQFDNIVALALKELGAGPGSIGEVIVRARQKEIANDNVLKGFALAVLAIGLGLITFGGGTVAVLAGAGAVGVSVYSAGEEWEKYSNAYAAAHTAFDPKDALSSDEPTLLWLALSLVAIGFDGAALIGAMRAAGPAAKVLSDTGDVAKFEATLAKAQGLSEGVRNSLAKSARAEKEFQAAAEDLVKYAGSRMGSNLILDPIYLGKVAKTAFFAAKEGIRDFQVFLAKLKLQKFTKSVDFDKLTAAELEALEKAFKQGVADFDAAVPAFSVEVRYASGTSRLTVGEGGQLLLDGKAVGKTEREEIFKQLGLTHANRGHGALRDPVTIANEALQNAAKKGNAGMSSIFASDEVMLRMLEAARAEAAAGRAVQSGARYVVNIPATPDAGRVFVAKSHIPAGVTPINTQPLASLPEVAELPVTHVRALFSQQGGVWQIEDIFPAFIP